MSEGNLERLKAAYAAWADPWAASPEPWLEMCDEAVTVGSLGVAAGGEVQTGKTAAREYLQRLAAEWEMLSFDMSEFVADGDRIVVLGHITARHKESRRLMDSRKVDAYRFRNGRIVDYFEYLDTAAELSARR